MSTKICNHCNEPTNLRNPSGYCDHSNYPESCEICRESHEREVLGKSADYVDQIQLIRADNNKHWMDILRLALRARPAEAREILKSIVAKDKEITKTLEKVLKNVQ